jgi:ring-1,2-phenylacetyl-CoA epoxidase subunit PaaE
MGLLSKIFSKNKKQDALPKGFVAATVRQVNRLTKNSVELQFDLETLPADFRTFTPGQYINIAVQIDGETLRRSYSLCSSVDEGLRIGVKKLNGGKVSSYLVDNAENGTELFISKPEGNFNLQGTDDAPVFIAAGSGITPILSMLKTKEKQAKKSVLLYANRAEEQMMFKNEIAGFEHTEKHLFLSKEEKEGFKNSRLDADTLKVFFKENLPLLRASGFYICGPEEMIKGAIDALHFFGIAYEKIHFELFTEAKILKKASEVATDAFHGNSQVTIILDQQTEEFELSTKGSSILEAALKEGLDAPYSCKGGVCSTCRAKVLEGSARMNNNLTLTDKEIAEGYILTCQSYPSSEKITVSYDE